MFGYRVPRFLRDIFPISSGLWEGLPDTVLEFAGHYGLLRHSAEQGRLCFPLATLLAKMVCSHRSPMKREAIETLYSDFVELACEMAAGTDGTSSVKLVEGLLRCLSEREKMVLSHRAGIYSTDKWTLARISERLGVTRERVRQIETGARKRLMSHGGVSTLRRAVLRYIMERGGSTLVMLRSADYRFSRFLCEQCDIPVARLERIGVAILGHDEGLVPFPSLTEMKQQMVEGVHSANRMFPVAAREIPFEDAQLVIQRLTSYAKKKLNKRERAVWALRKIGRPAHFAEVARVHNELFPEHSSTTHNVHAVMTRADDGCIVWTGRKGVYALKEWGYEKPDMDLVQTVAVIVHDLYRRTGQPVTMDCIIAEMGNYRKLFNRNSVLMAAQFNDKLISVAPHAYLPISAGEQEETSFREEQLDEILRKYEG